MARKKAGSPRWVKRHRLDRGWTMDVREGGTLGPGMTRADDATIRAALQAVDPPRPWQQARHDVLPMLPRARPFPFAVEPIRTMLPPGILVGFGVDLGPALTLIDREQLDRWGVDVAVVAGQALANVRDLAARCEAETVVREVVHGVPVAALQTRSGIGAALLLVPETIPRLFGPEPRLFLAPMRDLLVGLPASVDRTFAQWLADEWESLDPNHLHLGGWLFEAGRLSAVPLESDVALA